MLDQTIVSYFSSASPVVQAVLGLLLLASVFSWTVIFQRGFGLSRARRASKRFEKQFWQSDDIQVAYAALEKTKHQEGMETIFKAGFSEYKHLQEKGLSKEIALAGAQRAMKAAATYEEEDLEAGLSFLGTIGSTSPYVGLFGTVWGIMTSFHALGAAQQVTISMVAPGISEALVATAMGLFAAIPAVIFYNRYVTRVNRILNRYDAFQESFVALLYRESN